MLTAVKRIPVIISIVIAVPVFAIVAIMVLRGRWSDKRGWEGFQEDLERRGLKGIVQITPSSDETLVRTITYTIAANSQQTQIVTVLEFRNYEAKYRRLDTLKAGEQTNFARGNGLMVMTCEFAPPNTNCAKQVNEIFGHHRR